MKRHSAEILCGILLAVLLALPSQGLGKIFLDINAPSIQRIKIAIPDFRNTAKEEENTRFSQTLPSVVANDLDLSGYFTPMDKAAFLEEAGDRGEPEETRLRNWSAIGADLLMRGNYTCIGRSLEVEVRLFDIFRARQILGKRYLGKVGEHRSLMHRVANDVIEVLTGYRGMFLSRLAFVGTATGNKEIYFCDLDGHNVKRITSDKSISLFPRWSPKGDKLLFNSFKEGGAKLYMKDLSSGSVRRISGRKGLNIGASWAPDAESMSLTLSLGDNPDVYRIDLQGKILGRLVSHWGIDVSPSFSPDGKKIAFVSNRSGSPQIYVRDLIEGKEERLTFEGKYNTSPAWSSLNRIAFSGMVDGALDIYVIDADGNNLRRLTENQGKNEDPCWSPDGRYIVFSSNRDGRYHLYLMNANGLNQRRITSHKGEQTSPSWSPF